MIECSFGLCANIIFKRRCVVDYCFYKGSSKCNLLLFLFSYHGKYSLSYKKISRLKEECVLKCTFIEMNYFNSEEGGVVIKISIRSALYFKSFGHKRCIEEEKIQMFHKLCNIKILLKLFVERTMTMSSKMATIMCFFLVKIRKVKYNKINITKENRDGPL